MQLQPHYENVVAEVRRFLEARVESAHTVGIDSERIAIDPGFGFGKTQEHNLALLRGLDRLQVNGTAVMVGISRKSMLGKIAGRDIGERVFAGIAATLIAIEKGARIVRTHDVAAMHDALAVWTTVNSGSK
jgi:dihydropteroate synthase